MLSYIVNSDATRVAVPAGRVAILGCRPTELFLAAALALPFSALPAASKAQVSAVEEVVKVPIPLTTRSGAQSWEIVVTIFHDAGQPKSPFLVLNHGRTSNEAERAAMGRVRYSEISQYLVSLGFAVLVPTRIGYGVTGGPDVEYSGHCNDRNYVPGFDAAAEETALVLQRARTLPYVDVSRGIVAGTSFGGMTAIKLATLQLPGLVGAVNFSGGVGGDPKGHPGKPCSPLSLDALYRSYGATARVPSLWLYSRNDHYWGPQLPKQWFRTYVAAGGRAQFVDLPAYGEDGHQSFAHNPEAWKPAFERFLRSLGFMV
jgi:dienelactone hydrolase